MNPLIVLIAIDPACLPGARFPASSDDHDVIDQLVPRVLHSFDGTPFAPNGASSVSVFTMPGHLILDISASSTARTPGGKKPLDAFTSLAKDRWIACGLMSGTQAELGELKKTRITFRSPMRREQEQAHGSRGEFSRANRSL